MIWTIRLTLADVPKADALVAVDDERRWPSDVERGEPETVIDAVAFDHRAVRVDEDRKRQAMGAVISRHPLGTLADDHQNLRSQVLIYRQMGVQLLQLHAAAWSPGAADEHYYRGPGAEHSRQLDFLPIAGA
jgi:hypothetical protein